MIVHCTDCTSNSIKYNITILYMFVMFMLMASDGWLQMAGMATILKIWGPKLSSRRSACTQWLKPGETI